MLRATWELDLATQASQLKEMDSQKLRTLFALALPSIAALTSSGLLLSAYAHGYYLLGFVALVPWLIALEQSQLALERKHWRSALFNGVLMSMVHAFAVFAWFGTAIAAYIGINSFAGVVLICVLAPIWQPQFLIYALIRNATRKRSRWLSVWLATAAWVVSEWLLPKVLGDTLGHGLAPSLWLRQGADLAGAEGLTAVLLIVNAAIALAWSKRSEVTNKSTHRWRDWLGPLTIALLLPTVLAAYGALRLRTLQQAFAEPAPSMRVGLVQTSMVDYEQRRQQQGSFAVVRDVLDQHFALSRAAIEHHGAEALVWSETVYPTPYGHPRSADGAAFDFELKSFIEVLNVPLLFGSYDVDSLGEYNAAVLLDPKRALTARYRKTRLFPFTEQVPRWLDSAWLRRLLPWTGHWLAGDGARVFPLTASDGRELQVVPLICLDDVDPMLAIEGARLGAQAIVGLSNDSWFSQYPNGMRLHLAVASFRSIETRMPQLRVTTNGHSAFVDPSGEVLARTGIGDQSVLAGEVPIRTPPPTLVTRWGQWLAPAALGSMLLLGLLGMTDRMQKRAAVMDLPEISLAHISLLTKPARFAAAALQLTAALGLAYLAARMWLLEGWRVHSITQLQLYAGMVLMPLLLAGLILRWYRVRVEIVGDRLQITSGKLDQVIELSAVQSIRRWRLALPRPGVDVVCTTPHQSSLSLTLETAQAIQWTKAVVRKLSASATVGSKDWFDLIAARHRMPWRVLDLTMIKFLLFALIMAVPAFRLHQVISFGGSFGEYDAFGAAAYLQGLLIWWGSWSLGLMLWAALLRMIAEVTLLVCTAWARPALQITLRTQCEWALRALFYLAVPIWFAIHVFGD